MYLDQTDPTGLGTTLFIDEASKNFSVDDKADDFC